MFKKFFYALIWIALMAGSARAGAIHVACAAGLTAAMEPVPCRRDFLHPNHRVVRDA